MMIPHYDAEMEMVHRFNKVMGRMRTIPSGKGIGNADYSFYGG